MDTGTPPTPPTRPRLPGGWKTIAALVAVALLLFAPFLFFRKSSPPAAPPPVRAAGTPAPSAAPLPSDSPADAADAADAAARPSAPGAPGVNRPPPPTPFPVPASNAFTTLEDYRRRRASMPHPTEPLVPAAAGRTPETELGKVSFTVRDFRAAFGENPVGNNREITRTLMGQNATGRKFLDPASASLNDKGEWLDGYGRPYFFHALSGTVMEIRSAGPDGKLFTSDDLVR